MPADHAPALVGDAAIQLRRAESASGPTGRACSPSSEGCLRRRSSGGRRGPQSLRRERRRSRLPVRPRPEAIPNISAFGCRAPFGEPPASDRSHTMAGVLASPQGDNWLELTSEPLPTEQALKWVERPSCGAVACFAGTVRDHAEGRTGVRSIDYEAYTSQVLPRFSAIVAAAHERWPDSAGRWCGTGSGTSSWARPPSSWSYLTPHREEAFDACRYPDRHL